MSNQSLQEPAFVPGRILSGEFYREWVGPLLAEIAPGLPHAAALIGSGSEVLGFDDAMSTDHHWGPRVMIFLTPADHAAFADRIGEALRWRLPTSFRGYPTNFSDPDPDDNGVQLLTALESGPVNHRVSMETVAAFLRDYVAYDVTQPLTPADWLTIPQQKLRTIADAAVYHDDIGLGEVVSAFNYYPRDVWMVQMAAVWTRIGQEEHLMGRAGYVGDEVGAALIGARLVHDVMHLCFLQERTYAPYPKWFGTAFARLACADELQTTLAAALAAPTWPEREAALRPAYEAVARRHNELGITPPLPAETVSFFGRPWQVIALHGFADALVAAIQDPAVAAIARRTGIGGIDVFSDNTDLREATALRARLAELYSPNVGRSGSAAEE
jgi:hypothetical protein